jgi:hypothetical protein
MGLIALRSLTGGSDADQMANLHNIECGDNTIYRGKIEAKPTLTFVSSMPQGA